MRAESGLRDRYVRSEEGVGVLATTTMEKVRAWRGPAVLSYGFRPFFLGGALYAGLVMALWVPWFLGEISLPSAFDPVSWHNHALLFGFVPAVVAGFLMTAVPNWTGRLPVVGWPLAGLVALWLAGRCAVALSLHLPPLVTALVTLAFPVVLALVIGREIVAGRNWRNLKVLAVLVGLTAAQAWFHALAAQGADTRPAAHAGLAAAVLLITLIGGRIVPSFTTNWLKRAKPGRLPAPPDGVDRFTLMATAVALVVWVAVPVFAGTGPTAAAMAVPALLIGAGLLNLVRLLRWVPHRTWGEPLVTVLPAAYAFVPLGFLLVGAGAALDQPALGTAGVHAWGAGAIGLMTLAVMTRASRAHTGRPLTAPAGTVGLYLAVTVAALTRIGATLWPDHWSALSLAAGGAWCAAFLGFALLYGPMLLRPRPVR